MALVIVKTSTMPGWLQAFVKVDPVSHLTAAARDLMNAHHHHGVRAAYPPPLR